MGISRLTMYEIAGNPDDIVVTHAGPNEATGKYAGWITRGPKHRFKPLVNTPPVFDTAEAAEEAMRKLVQEAEAFTEKDLEDPDNPIREVLEG